MQYRIPGAVVIAAAVYCLWVGLRAVFKAPEAADMFADLGQLFAEPIDRTDLLFHWRVTHTLFSVGSALALIAGVAMLFLKRWSCLLLAGIAIAALAINLVGRLTGYTRYGFEGGTLGDFLLLLTIPVLMYIAYRKWPANVGHGA